MYAISAISPSLQNLPTLETRTSVPIPIDRLFYLPGARLLTGVKETLMRTFYYLSSCDMYVPLVADKYFYEAVMSAIINNNGNFVGMVIVINPKMQLTDISYENGKLEYTRNDGVIITHENLDDELLDYVYGISEVEPEQYFVKNRFSFLKENAIDIFNKKVIGEAVLDMSTISKYDPGQGAEFLYTKYDYILDYLSLAPEVSEDKPVPILVGHTGIAKSKMVEAIVDKISDPYGSRLQIFRSSFLDKGDIDGFLRAVADDDQTVKGKKTVYTPISDFYMSSDQFVTQCREILKKFDVAKLKSAEDKEAYAVMKEYAKTPIIFFDELNRCTAEIKNACLKILNEKALSNTGLTFKKAKFIAAANWSVGTAADSEYEWGSFYDVLESNDIAFVRRFITVKMNPKDAELFQPWLVWAKNNIHPLIYDYVSRKPEERCYDWSDAEEYFAQGYLPREVAEYPIVTFRGWEYTSDYLKTRDKDKVFVKDHITNIIGKSAVVQGLFAELLQAGWTEETVKKHVFDDAIDECLKTGIPIFMQGVTGVAKTARIKRLAREDKIILIAVDLQQARRVDLRGALHSQKPVEAMFPPSLLGSKVAIALEDGIRGLKNFPDKTMMFAPDKLNTDKIRAWAKENEIRIKNGDEPKYVVLFFDECNRCDANVQSVIFDAISNRTFKGVEFPPNVLRVILAGNVGKMINFEGEEVGYTDAKGIDPALTARCMVVRKTEIDESDKQSFLEYARAVPKGQKHPAIHPALANAIENLPIEEYRQLFESIADRKIDNHDSTPSSLEAFSTQLMTYDDLAGTKLWRGGFIFLTGKVSVADFEGFSTQKKSCKSLFPDMWVGNQGVAIKWQGNTITGKDVIDTMEHLCKKGVDSSELIQWYDKLCLSYETAIREGRWSMVTNFLSSPRTEEILKKMFSTVEKELSNAIPFDALAQVDNVPLYVKEHFLSDLRFSGDVKALTDALIALVGKIQSNFKYSTLDFAKMLMYMAKSFTTIPTRYGFLQIFHAEFATMSTSFGLVLDQKELDEVTKILEEIRV